MFSGSMKSSRLFQRGDSSFYDLAADMPRHLDLSRQVQVGSRHARQFIGIDTSDRGMSGAPKASRRAEVTGSLVEQFRRFMMSSHSQMVP